MNLSFGRNLLRHGALALLVIFLLVGCRVAPDAALADADEPPANEATVVMSTATQVVTPVDVTATGSAPLQVAATPTTTSLPPTPTASATPSPTPTQAPALRQLVTGGCCVNPVWSADGEAVRFLDRPAPDAAVGIYEVAADVPAPVTAGTLFTTTIRSTAGGGRFYVLTERESTTIEDLASGRSYTIPSEGNQVAISPGGTRVAWQVRDETSGVPQSERQTTIWMANLDGRAPRALVTLSGLSDMRWLDEESLLLQLRQMADLDDRLLVRYDIENDETTVLDRAARFNGVTISRDGSFLAYYVSLDQDEPEQNGIWVMDAASGVKHALPVTGAYQWRDGERLLVIPMEMGAPAFRLQEYDASTGALRDLTDPATLPFRVANNDWVVSPDGSRVVFVSADDGNLWLLEPGD